MITRISELNSEERRKIIEDIIGLSYFDEKKNQALKQLEESDRRLEIALSKMDDVKNRIDEIESERNDQHRFVQLEQEIKRLKAIKISDKIDKIDKDITDFNNRREINKNNIKVITEEINKIGKEIEQVNNEKEQFLILSNDSNKEKKELETRLSSVVYQYERISAIIKESQYYLNQTNQREKNNEIGNKIHLEKINSQKINEKLEKIIKEIEKNNVLTVNEINRKNFPETRLKKLSRLKGEFEINIARNEEKIKNLSDKIKNNDIIIVELFAEKKENEKRISELNFEIKEL